MQSYTPEMRIVAFIDVLGFREQTKRRLGDPALLKALDGALMYTDRLLFEPYDGYTPDARMFSDCICVSSPFEPDNVVKFTYTIEALQMNLACCGVFVRGGIAIGRHFENPRMIVSEALIDAYLLENEAMFPRIVASPATVTRLLDILQYAGPDHWGAGPHGLVNAPTAHFRTDRDGKPFISYLMSLYRIDRSSIVDEYIMRHRDAVEAWLFEGHASSLPAHITTKHQWARNYHNDMMCDYFGTDKMDATEFIPESK
ncbi:MAG: hypothetical protein JO036_12730 [Candidatus Eremiobacteraeota bacterium]|nr:hypothetical protein [Candidatus Eremiobacteraeota bacterium]